MKTIKKTLFVTLILFLAMGTNLIFASDTDKEIISEVMRNINKTSCNQYLTENNHYFVKICPKEYREIDIDYDTEDGAITYVMLPLRGSKFITKYDLTQILKEQSNIAQYFHVSESEYKAWIDQSDIISTTIDRYNDDIDMNIRYAVVIFKNIPKSWNLTKEDIIDLGTIFGQMVTRDEHFALTNSKENSQMYVPRNEWIYDRVNRVYYYYDKYGDIDNPQCNGCFEHYFKIKLKPNTVFWVSCRHNYFPSKKVGKAFVQIINRFSAEIQTINENKKYKEIIFKHKLNRKQIEKMIEYFIIDAYAKYPVG